MLMTPRSKIYKPIRSIKAACTAIQLSPKMCFLLVLNNLCKTHFSKYLTMPILSVLVLATLNSWVILVLHPNSLVLFSQQDTSHVTQASVFTNYSCFARREFRLLFICPNWCGQQKVLRSEYEHVNSHCDHLVRKQRLA